MSVIFCLIFLHYSVLPFITFPVFFQLSASLTLKKSLFGSTPKKHVEAPFLYQWLGKLQDALVSKVIFIQFYVRHSLLMKVVHVNLSICHGKGSGNEVVCVFEKNQNFMCVGVATYMSLLKT